MLIQPPTLTLTYAQFVAKWTERFAYNEWEEIDDAAFREYTLDLAATFGTPAVNVPTYLAGSDYTAGFLVRYAQAGGRESFYYALLDGKLPHPTYNQSDANWKLVPGPVPETTLYQYITLDEAQGIDGDRVAPGRRYGVVGKWNASADDQLVYLDGLENYFRQRGTLVHADGSQQEVSVSVGLGTYAAVTTGGGNGYTDAQARAAQLNRGALVGTGTVTLTAESATDYGTLTSGTLIVDATGCVVGKCVRFAVASGAAAPELRNAPGGQPYKPAGDVYVSGRSFTYSLLVCVDRIEVVILAD